MNIPQITFTRFIASISIVALHFGLFSQPMVSPIFRPFGNDLIAAMSYFFILSGFIMVISVSKDQTLPIKINHRQFWLRRAARILPIYFLALAAFALMNFHYNPDVPLFTQLLSYIKAFFLIQSWDYKTALDINFPSWSLSVEAFFYFIFPWLYKNIIELSSKTILRVAIIAWLLNLYIFRTLYIDELPISFLRYFPLLHLATFLTGMCSAVLFIRHYKWLQEKVRNTTFLISLIIIIIFGYTMFYDYSFYKYQHNGLLSPFYLAIIISLALTSGKLKKIFSSTPLIFLGDISYSIYILQYPVYQLCKDYLPFIKSLPPHRLFYPYVLILIAISALTYYFIEKPCRSYFIKNKRLLKNNL